MLTKVTGVVLRSYRYKESSALIHLYTKEYGRITCIMNGVFQSNKGKRSKSALIQALTPLEAELYYKSNDSIHRLKTIQPIRSFTDIHFNVVKNTIGLFMCEILNLVIREEEKNEELFDFISLTIDLLDETRDSLALFPQKFLIGLSKFIGFYPQANHSESNRYFDIRSGKFESLQDQNFTIPELESRDLFDLMSCTFEEFKALRMKPSVRDCLLESLLEYYYYHVEGMKQVKSVDILRQIFE